MELNPNLLSSRVDHARKRLAHDRQVISYAHHWQFPAITEKTAYESILPHANQITFEYLGIPWATIIDGLRSKALATWELLRVLNQVPAQPNKTGMRRATVAQHINADKYIELYLSCHVTDLFWSHATFETREICGIRIHPFPLFPAQTPNGPDPADNIHRPRSYLANFIGAYNPKVYLTDVRENIFKDAGSADDLLIIKRDAWHFNRTVYAEQMKGLSPDAAKLALEDQHKKEYLQAIRDSAFTLCPTGSGPNSIRIGEALALASIPVILTRDLALPGPASLWQEACVFEEDSSAGYQRALSYIRNMPVAKLRAMQVATQKLYARVGPRAWDQLIINTME
ncbi:MAG: exostosin family protein [Roseovarius sp.]|jgi:hypothetical protein|nr:exostosin family protein [Roseovarius sp.]